MKGPLFLPWNIVREALLASCRGSGYNSWARPSDLSGLLEVSASATETKAVELFNKRCFGAQKGGDLSNFSLLMPLQVPGTFKLLIHLLYASSFP